MSASTSRSRIVQHHAGQVDDADPVALLVQPWLAMVVNPNGIHLEDRGRGHQVADRPIEDGPFPEIVDAGSVKEDKVFPVHEAASGGSMGKGRSLQIGCHFPNRRWRSWYERMARRKSILPEARPVYVGEVQLGVGQLPQ